MDEKELRQSLQPFKGLRQDYGYSADIMCPDDSRVLLVKHIIENLDEGDKAIIRLYAELGSIAKLARLLQISKSSVHNEVTRIRTLILAEYEHLRKTPPTNPHDSVDSGLLRMDGYMERLAGSLAAMHGRQS